MGDAIRLGIVGCGAVVEKFHLPAIAGNKSVKIAALADPQVDRAGKLAAKYNVPVATHDYTDLSGLVDAVLIAVPHNLHAPVSINFLQQGIHVLCEKPMAVSVKEGEQMLEVANQSRAKLAIGLIRRFFDNSRFVKRMIETDLFGPVKRFEIEDSVSFEQYGAAGFLIHPNVAGSGLLFDTGVHVLDLLGWWFGKVNQVAYWDDNRGGVEANCYLTLEMQSGITGQVTLSRMRKLKNVVRLYTADTMLEIPTLAEQNIQLHDCRLGLKVEGHLRNVNLPLDNDLWTTYFARQIDDFVEAILDNRPPLISGEEGLRSLTLIDSCLTVRQPLALAEWEKFDV